MALRKEGVRGVCQTLFVVVVRLTGRVSLKNRLAMSPDIYACGGCVTRLKPALLQGFPRGTAAGVYTIPLILCVFNLTAYQTATMGEMETSLGCSC